MVVLQYHALTKVLTGGIRWTVEYLITHKKHGLTEEAVRHAKHLRRTAAISAGYMEEERNSRKLMKRHNHSHILQYIRKIFLLKTSPVVKMHFVCALNYV